MAPTVARRGRKEVSVKKVVYDVLRSQQELKRSETGISNTAWTTTGVVTPISQEISQGDAIGLRNGDKITPKFLEMNLIIVSALVPYLGRVIVFQDMLNVGVDPTVQNVLDTVSYTSVYLPETRQQRRFKILYDETHSSITSSTIVTSSTKIFKKLKFPMKGKIHYNGSSNATASNGPGAIYALFISDAASGAGAYYNYYTALSYTDS